MSERTPRDCFRYCPACAHPALDRPDPVSITCPECGFRFFFNAASAAAAIVVNGAGEVLFTRRAREPAQGKLDLPGGFIDPYETAEDGIRRELREELGIEVIELRYVTSHPNRYLYRGVAYPVNDLIFQCRLVGDVTSIDESEIAEWLFLRPGKVEIEELSFSSIRAGFRAYRDSLR